MNVRIYDGSMPTSEALNGQVRTRLLTKLGRVAGRVSSVLVRFSDVNAARGGVDKRCRIVASLSGGGAVCVESVERDYYRAAGIAVERCAAAVARKADAITDRIGRRRARTRLRPS